MNLDICLTVAVEVSCPHCDRVIRVSDAEIYTANITHNLATMADQVGLYNPLWRPHAVNVTHAKHLIEPLRAGIATLKNEPARFEELSPPNGWGSYENFVPWLEKLLVACEAWPSAAVQVTR